MFRIGLGIGKRQCASPGAAEHQPAVDLEFHPQGFDVVDNMPGRVGSQAGMRDRPAASALIEQQDPVTVRVKQPSVVLGTAGAWAAMEEHGGLSGRVSTQLPVDFVAVANIQHARIIGFYRRIGFAQKDLPPVH